MKKRASRWLRRVEISLWVVGISLLGVALGATLYRWQYQANQERAFSQMALAESEVATTPAAQSDAAVVAVAPDDPDDPAIAVIRQLDELDRPIEPRRIHDEGVDASPLPTPAIIANREAEVGPPPPPVKKKRSDAAADPSVFARLEIPRIGVAAIVRDGADEGTLRRAVGLVPGTARPGEAGNVVLAGHRDTFFRPLRRIKVDDRIRLVVPPNTYEYRVDSLRVVEPSETSVLESKGVEELTLITCYPFRFVGTAPDRFVVSATRVE